MPLSKHLLEDESLTVNVHEKQSCASSEDSSYTTLGTTKLSIKELRQRQQKTYVRSAFYSLVSKLQEKELQKLSYLCLYEELCVRIDRTAVTEQPTLSSPYSTFPSKAPHAALKKRFQRMASKTMVKILAKNAFQLACTLEMLWEHSLRIVEQKLNKGTLSSHIAEKLMGIAKKLPLQFSLFEDQKTLLHISSLKMHQKTPKKRLKKEEIEVCHQFLTTLIEFGYEHFGLSEPSLDLF